jgi:hypothetical protein
MLQSIEKDPSANSQKISHSVGKQIENFENSNKLSFNSSKQFYFLKG